MSVMTEHPTLPLIAEDARPLGSAAGIVEDAEGGRVFIHGNLTHCWDVGDVAARRFAAVSLMRIKAATQIEIAEAFGVVPMTLHRWDDQLAATGVAGLAGERKGPKRKSRLTDDMVAAVARLREGGASYHVVAERTGLSMGSIRVAVTIIAEKDSPATVVDEPDVEPEVEDVPEPEVEGPGCDVEPEAVVVPGVVVPVLAPTVDRRGERGLAAFGLVSCVPPVFTGCGHAPLAGALLAMPALVATGLLESAATTYGRLPNGFYGLDTMLVEAVLRALLGHTRAEATTRLDPIAFGRILGMDRAPEVKTIRRKIGHLAGAGKAGDWITTMAQHHAATRPDQMGVLYVDGHVRAYQGTRKIAKTHVPRLKFPAPATMETWVTDTAGDPLLVVTAEPAASLASELRRLVPGMRAVVGEDRRVLVGFDRGGWSPALFVDLHAAGFDTLTWRKGRTPDIADDKFSTHSYTDDQGRTHTWELADTTAVLDIADGPRKGETFTMRQISLRDPARTRQMHILTTREDLSAAEIRYRMGGRWRLENYFRFARMRLDLDSHDTYAHHDDDPARLVPNPAKKLTAKAVRAAEHALQQAETDRDTQLLAARLPKPGTSVALTNKKIDGINAGVRAAHTTLAAALAAHKKVPTRLPLTRVNPGQQVLDTETKLIHHAIRMAAFNTAQTLARTIATATGYHRADDEAHNLIRTALTTSGDIIPDGNTLHIRLDPLPTPRATTAITELCRTLNDTNTTYPGTNLTLRYSTKPHHRVDINS
jgi:prepilin-type processing-associated H-X9-DG protein